MATIYRYHAKEKHNKKTLACFRAFVAAEDGEIYMIDLNSPQVKAVSGASGFDIPNSVAPHTLSRGAQAAAIAKGVLRAETIREFLNYIDHNKIVEDMVAKNSYRVYGCRMLQINSIFKTAEGNIVNCVYQLPSGYVLAEGIYIERNIDGYEELLEKFRDFMEKTKADSDEETIRIANGRTIAVFCAILLVVAIVATVIFTILSVNAGESSIYSRLLIGSSSLAFASVISMAVGIDKMMRVEVRLVPPDKIPPGLSKPVSLQNSVGTRVVAQGVQSATQSVLAKEQFTPQSAASGTQYVPQSVSAAAQTTPPGLRKPMAVGLDEYKREISDTEKAYYAEFIRRAKEDYHFIIERVEATLRDDSFMVTENPNGDHRKIPCLSIFAREETFKEISDERGNVSEDTERNLRILWGEVMREYNKSVATNHKTANKEATQTQSGTENLQACEPDETKNSDLYKSLYDKAMEVSIYSYEAACYRKYINKYSGEVEKYLVQKLKVRPRHVYPAFYPDGFNIVFETEDYEKCRIDEVADALSEDIYRMAGDFVQKEYGERPERTFFIHFHHPGMKGYSGYNLFLG